MEYLEILENEQLEEAMGYIEAYPKNCTDKKMEEFIDDFHIRGKELRKIQSRQKYSLRNYIIKDKWSYDITDRLVNANFNVPLTDNEGSSKNQIELFKGILLSANYNFSRFENELFSEREKTEADILNNTYGGKIFKDLEKLRLKAAESIKLTEKFWGKITYMAHFGGYIYNGLEKIAEYKLIKEAAEKSMLCDTAKRMTEDGVSLAEITSCLGLSDEEEEFIKKAAAEEQKESMSQSGEETDEIREKLSNHKKYSMV